MSIEIPLYIFLILYLVYIIIFIIFSWFNIYHLIKHGFSSVSVYIIMFCYLIIASGIVFLTAYYIRDVQWTEAVPLLSEKFIKIKF